MVRCGIGGRTIEELRATMSFAEFQIWQKYAEKMGPLDPSVRIDRAVAAALVRSTGGKMADYMPWPRAPKLHEREESMTLATDAEVMKYVGGVVVSDDVAEGVTGRRGRKWRRAV